jgi:hypothetical protein
VSDIVKRSQSQKDVLDKIRKGALARPIASAGPIVTGIVGLDFRCSTTKKGYRVVLKKEADGRYKVERVDSSEGGTKRATDATHTAEALNINVNDVNLWSVRCPHCHGGKSPLIKCSCGGLSCAGGVKSIGNREQFECPWCGYTGYISGTTRNVTGTRHKGHQTTEGQTIGDLLPNRTQRMLDNRPNRNRPMLDKGS